ncbi:FAD-binding oxidoreductase [bacterium]|nr:FAD-binding oxidoreductase [bacterium]
MTEFREKVNALKQKINGRVVLPGDSDYDDIRKIWNAMIDRHPAAIVRVAQSEDVQRTIGFARENKIELTIRGAGHNIAGSAISENGIMIDLSTLKNVRVDAKKNRAYVDPGATLADFDAATQLHALATPVGINSTTGIAGLTLGGGFGWLTRKYAFTIDNLISADVITADGNKRQVNEKDNADLFWAIRGGGGNFGVVTQFEFGLHSVGPEVLAGLLVFPFDQAKQVLSSYHEFMKTAPEELNVWVVMRKAPPLPFLPESVHGKDVVVLAAFYSGEISAGQKLIDYIRKFGNLHGEHVGPVPYTAWQQAFDPLLTAGARNYWKSHNFTELSDGVFNTMIEYSGKLPSPHCEIFIGCISGAANRVSPEATAYRYRDAKFVMNVHGRWETAAEDAEGIAWARDFFKASKPFASAGAYVNFMTEEEGDRVSSVYGPNYQRLAEIKKKYDPDNVFHNNQNIRPS